jgi:acetyl esterase/lipase
MPVVDQPPRCGHEEGLPLPAALVGISGAYDLNPTGNAAHANATADPVLMAVVQILFVRVLAGADPDDPVISPARAELSGLPLVLLVASSSEILYRDSEDLTQLLASAGVACPLQVWDRQLHVFQAWAG